MTLEKLNKDLAAACAKRDAHALKVKETAARIEAIPKNIASIKEGLKSTPYYNPAFIKIGELSLEAEVLESSMIELNKELNSLNNNHRHIVENVLDKERDNKRAELVARFTELKATGANERTIRSELGLNHHEYERLNR